MALKKPDLNKPAFKVFPESKERITQNKCATCGHDINESDFKDEMSKREYSISGMCQNCQDGVFG